MLKTVDQVSDLSNKDPQLLVIADEPLCLLETIPRND
jgi:hypothetical protein